MSVVFPNSNLPTSSQPWGREVTKQLSNIIASSTSAQINNAARDNQLNSSIIALSAVANEASAAINGLLGLSSTGSEYTINAANITAGSISGDRISGGTIIGTTLLTASSGRRVAISGTSAVFYDDGGVYTGDVTSTGSSGSSILALSNVRNGGFGSSNTTRISLGQTSITLSTVASGAFGSVTVTVGGSGVNVDGFLTASGLQINNSGITTATFTGAVEGSGIRSTGVLGRTELATGDITGASFNTNGNLFRTGSSIRFKTDVSDFELPYDSIINAPNPKIFRLKDEVFGSEEEGITANENARYYAGFIAEDFVDTDLSIFVSNDRKNGEVIPSGFYYAEFTSVLLLAIKHQDQLIKSLTDRIETLEKGA